MENIYILFIINLNTQGHLDSDVSECPSYNTFLSLLWHVIFGSISIIYCGAKIHNDIE